MPSGLRPAHVRGVGLRDGLRSTAAILARAMADTDPRPGWVSVEHDGVEDWVAVEDPLEIRVDGKALAVTMRTPGYDEELALGFLYGEGLIDEARSAGPTDDLAANVVEVNGPLEADPGARRFYTSS